MLCWRQPPFQPPSGVLCVAGALFYSPQVADPVHFLEGEELQHLKVLRPRVGDTISLTNGQGGLYTGKVAALDRRAVRLDTRCVRQDPAPPVGLTLVVAPPKNTDRFEWLLEKATEFGVREVWPVWTARSERRSARVERWQRVVIAAMKQSQSTWLPVLHEARPYKEVSPLGHTACGIQEGFFGKVKGGAEGPFNSRRVPANYRRLPANCGRLPANRHRFPSNCRQLPSNCCRLPANGTWLPATRHRLSSNSRRLPSNRHWLPSTCRRSPSNSHQLPPIAVSYPPTAVAYPPIAVSYPPAAFGYPPTAVSCPPTAVGYPLTAVGYLPTVVAYQPLAAGHPPTAVG